MMFMVHLIELFVGYEGEMVYDWFYTYQAAIDQ